MITDGRSSCMSSSYFEVVGIVRVLRWIVCCMFEGFLRVVVRHADHGDTLLNGYRVPGYPGTQVERVPGYPGTRVPGPSVFMIMDGRSSCMRSN